MEEDTGTTNHEEALLAADVDLRATLAEKNDTDKISNNAPKGRGVVFRRKNKAAASIPDVGSGHERFVTNSYDSEDNFPVQSSSRRYNLSPLREEEEESQMKGSMSEQSLSLPEGIYSGNETSDQNFDSEPPGTPQFSGADDDDCNEGEEVFPANDASTDSEEFPEDNEGHDNSRYKQMEETGSWHPREPIPMIYMSPSRKDAVNPGSFRSTDEHVDSREGSNEEEEEGALLLLDKDDVVDSQMQHEGIEKRKGFHLLKLRKLKKKGADEFAMHSPSEQSISIDTVAEALTEEFPGPDRRQNKAPTQKKHLAFGRKKNKAGDAISTQPDKPVGGDVPLEGKKRLHLTIPHRKKGSGDEEHPNRFKVMAHHHGDAHVMRLGDSTPKKEKVGAKIKRKFKRAPKHKKGSSGDMEEWDWDSDSEDDHTKGNRSLSEDSARLDYDGSDIHAGDMFQAQAYGIAPPPVRDGIPVRARRAKDRKELRVKPLHCFSPHKVFMTEDEIYQNMLQPSEIVEHVESFVEPWYDVKASELSEMEQAYWGASSDGRIGSLRVEVLSCVGLAKHKADVSAYLICGDAAFSTEIIHGSRSPMWPACSKRAALFPVFHAYASLFVGIFDVTTKRNSENDLFCGRVTIDISALRPDSEYDVTLPLRGSSFIYDREPRGVVRVRFSLHWFSERAAILSYLKPARNMASTLFMQGQPSISCADPKTFRNVAVTIHGQELPGKYTRPAFRATMREFALYQLNIRFMAKTMLRDAVLYKNPILSLYIFFGWMHCIWYSSVRLVPVYVVGFLIFLLLDGYLQHGTNVARNLGYSPVSLPEMLLALLSNNKSRQINPLLTEKVARSAKEHEDEREPFDHREFPFSDRNEYKKRHIEEALVMRSNNARKEKREELQFQERMSIYVKPQTSMDVDSVESASVLNQFDGDESVMTNITNENEAGENEDGDREFDSDNETQVHGDEDNVFGLHSDEDEEGNNATSYLRRSSSSVLQSTVVVGPPQDTNVKPKKKVPPQVHLARFEEKLNKLTASLSMDKVFSSTLAYRPASHLDERFRSIMGEHPIQASPKKKGKRIPLDDFDKRLGYRVRHPNPVTEITSSFLGPLMRIFRILCVLVRVVFNVGVWSDPYLSFWVLCFLVLLMLVLIVFPWRLFLFVVGAVGFGPQNIFVGKRLENQAAAAEANEAQAQEDLPDEVELDATNGSESIPDENQKGIRRRRHNPLAKLKEHRQKKLAEKHELLKNTPMTSSLSALEVNSTGPYLDNRQPFAANTKATKKQVQPREIVVPYSRFRKERFFDWPPDPSVARATPVRFEDCVFDMNFTPMTPEKNFEEYADLRRSTMQ